MQYVSVAVKMLIEHEKAEKNRNKVMCVCDTGMKKSSPPLAFLLCKFQYLQLLQEIHFNNGSENRRESVGWKMPSFGSDISTFSLDQFLLFAFTVDSLQSSIEFMFFDDSI